MPPRTPTASSKYELIGLAAAVVISAGLMFFDELLLLIPFALLVALAIAGFYAYRLYRRTHGASRLAYHNAIAQNLNPPPPPKTLNWPEHVVYRHSLEKKQKPDPVVIPAHLRPEHELIVAGSGHGKSQLLEWQIWQDLNQPDPPAIVVIDSKSPDPTYKDSNLIDRISRLDIFNPDRGRLRDRIIIVDPLDEPALNIFDGHQNIADASAQLTYFLGALVGSSVSETMDVLLQPLAHLLVAHPNATLEDMTGAIEDINAYVGTIRTLPQHLQKILLTQLPQIVNAQTKNALRRRIVGLTTASPHFHEMFNAKTNKLDLVDAFNTGKIVLVSTDTNVLHDASPVFGKYFISRAMSAAKAAKRRAVYLYIDEALPYSDDKIQTVLATMRSYKLGAILAYQTFPLLPANLQAAVKSNTSIKFIGGEDDDAARIFARDFRVPPEFILNQTKDPADPPRFTRFALNLKTKGATSFQVPIGLLDHELRMPDGAYRALRAANKAKLTDPAAEPPQASVGTADVDEDE